MRETRTTTVTKQALFAAVAAAAAVACGASAGSEVGFLEPTAACIEGSTRACDCGGDTGSQACVGGDYGACSCDVELPATPPPAPACGDRACNGEETCTSCPADCGACPACDFAPSCTSAVGVPSSTVTRRDLCQTFESEGPVTPPADPGPGDCLDPKLRLRIEKITTRNGGAKIFCIVSATDGLTSEVAITPLTRDMKDGDEHFFDPSAAVFWGQKELHATTNNLAVTFNCFRNRDKAWENALTAMGDAARKAGVFAGTYGWAFGAGAIAADAAAAAIKAAGEQDLVLNAQQVIDRKKLLDLTNGRDWFIRQRKGGGLFGGGWDWEVRVQSWGCADARPAPR